ncbi:MAG TPA: hypothetical protein VM286_08190 [Candidatus Thermoplasmatota archaeon]|nr:hypothetical protein [Candidatus Thermoplasmatota archaeon]
MYKPAFLILADEMLLQKIAAGDRLGDAARPFFHVLGAARARGSQHYPRRGGQPIASMKMLSQDEGLISPRDWKLNAERQFFSC